MASNRMLRVEETLRRGIADALLSGAVSDPRLQGVNFSVTGVKVDTELTLARVFVDLLSPEHDRKLVLAGLRSAAGVIRRALQGTVHLRRIPDLRFEYDESIAQGLRIESILSELNHPAKPSEPANSEPPASGEGGEHDRDDERDGHA